MNECFIFLPHSGNGTECFHYIFVLWELAYYKAVGPDIKPAAVI